MPKIKNNTPAKYPDLIQPKDINHELYKVVNEFLLRGDIKVIALELKVKSGFVGQVACGKGKSMRVWQRIIETVMVRKEQQDSFMAYMKKPLPDKAA